MQDEYQEYPRAVTELTENLISVEEVDEALAKNQKDLELAITEENDHYHPSRKKDLEEMKEALIKRRHELAAEKAA